MTDDKMKILDRVQALLDKAESTTFEEEAKAYFEKAQQLLTRHALSELDLKGNAAVNDKDTVTTVCVLISEPTPAAKRVLLTGIARANNLKVVQGSSKMRRDDNDKVPFDHYTQAPMRVVSADKAHKHYQRIWLTGFTKDIDTALMLYTSMLIQIAREVKKANIPSYENKHTWTSHFIISFANVISARLRKAADTTRKEIVEEYEAQGVNVLPVLVSRDEQVKTAYEQVWQGNLRSSRANYKRTYTTGSSAGSAAGRRADIGSKKIGGSAALGRGN